MDYIGFCDAVDKSALKHVSDISKRHYLTAAQAPVYIIGRINEELLAQFPGAKIATDYSTYYDPHEWGGWYYYVTSTIIQKEITFQYCAEIHNAIGKKEFTLVNKERPPVTKFQERVQKYSAEVFASLVADSTLSSSQFITAFERDLIARLEETYDRKGFEVSLTISHGACISYSAVVEDTVDGTEVKLDIGREDYVTEDETVKGLKWSKDFSLKTVYANDPEFFTKLSKVRATIEFTRIATNALSDAFLSHEDRLDTLDGALAVHGHVMSVLQEAAPPCKFTINVTIENRTATLNVEEAVTKVKFRLRATRQPDAV
jgi:hypothetical protein